MKYSVNVNQVQLLYGTVPLYPYWFSALLNLSCTKRGVSKFPTTSVDSSTSSSVSFLTLCC